MANYLIVVPRGNPELLDLLSVAFRGHTGFTVVIDRRGTDSAEAPAPSEEEAERRGSRVQLGPDDIVVAERAERADRPFTGGEAARSFQRIPVRRRRARRSAPGTGGPQHARGVAGPGSATVC